MLADLDGLAISLASPRAIAGRDCIAELHETKGDVVLPLVVRGVDRGEPTRDVERGLERSNRLDRTLESHEGVADLVVDQFEVALPERVVRCRCCKLLTDREALHEMVERLRGLTHAEQQKAHLAV